MADWNLPVNTTAYTNVLQNLKDRDVDCATMDFSTATNIPDGTIRWNAANSRFEKWNATASAWEPLATLYNINVNQLDGYDAGNASGNIPVSNGTLNTNLNADMVDGRHAGNANGNIPINNSVLNTNLNADLLDGYHAGNASGNVPVSNGTLNTNLNADMLDGRHAGNASGNIPVNNGTLNTNLNADMVDGKHATSFVHDPVGSGLMAGDEIFEVSTRAAYASLASGGIYIFAVFYISVPAGKVLRVRRLRFRFINGDIRLRITKQTSSQGTTTIWTSTTNRSDAVVNITVLDNSAGASAEWVEVGFVAYNAGTNNSSSSQEDTIWAQFTIT